MEQGTNDDVELRSSAATGGTALKASTESYGFVSGLVTLCLLLMTLAQILAYCSHPLENAIAEGDINALRRAVANGHDVNGQDDYARSMLNRAILYGIQNHKLWGQPEARFQTIYSMLQVLLDGGADVNMLDGNKTLPLCLAINWADINAVKLLIEKGADINLHDGHGDTPLHFAVRAQTPEIVTLLLKKGADVDAENDRGETPRQLFADIFQSEIRELLAPRTLEE